MKFTKEAIDGLRLAVCSYMSERCYAHTLGVERMAARLAAHCLPEEESALRCAALLHDVAKELSQSELMAILKKTDDVVDSDLACSAAHHAFAAPYVIKRDFPEFADENILSAVFNHTTGAPDMTVFDEIIFISDYIEDGRSYPECIACREELLSALRGEMSPDMAEQALHGATIRALDNTIASLVHLGKYINERTVATRNAFLGRRAVPIKR